MEWKPLWESGNSKHNLIATIQLSTQKTNFRGRDICLLYVENFNEEMKNILANMDIIKAGVGIGDDTTKLFENTDLHLQNYKA